jgi:transposase
MPIDASSDDLDSLNVALSVRRAGHDQGAVNWACIASLIETAKLQDIDPKPYLADILSKLVNGWPMAKIDELLPWAWAQHSKARLAA